MIEHCIENTKLEDIFKLEADAIINVCSCSAYLDNEFSTMLKKRYVENYNVYHKAITSNLVYPGKSIVYSYIENNNTKYILNIPIMIKDESDSKLEYIEKSLIDIKYKILDNSISSIVLPQFINDEKNNFNYTWLDIENMINRIYNIDNPSENSDDEKISKTRVIIFSLK
jgi:hypothetical protein